MNLRIDVVNSPIDIRDYSINADANFPDEFECPVKVGVKNQGSKPTCVAHAISSLLEYHYKKQVEKTRVFSTEFIYGFRPAGYYVGDGMMIRNALATALKYGDTFKTDCPGNNDVAEAMKNVNAKLDTLKELAYPHRISTYYRCYNEAQIKTALMKYGPVVISMNTYSGAKLEDDVYTYNPDASYGCHCVLIVGWNDIGWKIQNSWGTSYGGDGYFILPYEFNWNEAWGVTDTINDEDHTIKKPNAFVTWLSRFLNSILNWFNNILD